MSIFIQYAPHMPKRTPAADADKNGDGPDPVERFEQNMAELEGIVERMEQGELKLEESLKLFERGTQLAQSCRQSLDAAELKLKTLNAQGESEGGAPQEET